MGNRLVDRLVDKVLEAANTLSKSSRKPSVDYMVVSTSIGDMIIEVYKQERSNLIREKIKKIFDLK